MNPIYLIALPIGLLLSYLLFQFIERKLIYEPGHICDADPSSVGINFEDVWLTSRNDKKIHGWWMEKENARLTIIQCHGNADNIAQRIYFAQDFAHLPINILMYDYQGYGKSSGKPNWKNTQADGQAAYDFVQEKVQEKSPHPIILYGVSLGGATAIELATTRKIDGLIIESTFTSIVAMGRRFHPYLLPDLLTSIRYDSLSKVPRLTMPKIFAHSQKDERIPFEMGEALYQAAAEPKEWVELKGEHGEFSFQQTPGYQQEVERFILAIAEAHEETAAEQQS